MIIVSIEKRRIGSRYDVVFEDGSCVTMPRTMARGLRAGGDEDADALREKARAKDAVNAREACFYALERSDKSRAELMRFLTVRGYDEDIAEATIDRLQEAGYINDAALAQRMAENSKTGKGAIKQRMMRRGITGDTAAEALGEVSDVDQARLARALADKLRAQGRDDMKIRAALARRGFGYDIIVSVIRDEDFE